MNTRKIKTLAERDAVEFARSQMYFGEGAGNRRKLISASVESRMNQYSDYGRWFNHFYSRQDMAQHASLARKERRRKDILHATNKNIKAAASGNYGGINAAVLVGAVAVYYAHKTGWDRRTAAKMRARYTRMKTWMKKEKDVADAKVHDIRSAMTP